VVTGGARGIGSAIAQRLLASRVRVWVRDTAAVDREGIDSAVVDVTNPDQIARAFAAMVDQGSRIDILVNNAGYLGKLHAFDAHEPDDWQRIIQVNLIDMLQVTHLVLPHMRRWGGGRIVNLGSLAGKEGLAQLAAYSAASAGVIAFTKALGREIVNSSILVNSVAAGPH